MLICNHHLLTVTFPDLCWQKKVINQSVGQNHKQNHKRTDITIHETAWALFKHSSSVLFACLSVCLR